MLLTKIARRISRTATTVTPESLTQTLEGDKWQDISFEDGVLKAKKMVKNPYSQKLSYVQMLLESKLSEPLYEVKVHSIDDPSDSDDESTADPVGFINDFIKQGLPEVSVASLLRRIALHIEKSGQTKKFASLLLRIATYAGLDSLQKDLEKKDWEVEKGDNRLIVNIDDVFKAEIGLDTVMWDTKVSMPALNQKDSGTGDDPYDLVYEFMKYKRVHDAMRKQVGVPVQPKTEDGSGDPEPHSDTQPHKTEVDLRDPKFPKEQKEFTV